MAGYLRAKKHDKFLTPEWLGSYTYFKNSRALLGFLVEQSCLSAISHNGILGLVPGAGNITYYSTDQPIFDMQQKCTLYIPNRFNNKAIDGLLLRLDEQNAYVIPIQTTIASKHKDSATTFRNCWMSWGPHPWLQHLYPVYVDLETVADHDQSHLQPVYGQTKSGEKYLIKPGVIEHHMSVMDLNNKIGNALAVVRN